MTEEYVIDIILSDIGIIGKVGMIIRWADGTKRRLVSHNDARFMWKVEILATETEVVYETKRKELTSEI